MKSIFLNKFNFDSSRSEFRSLYVDIVKGVAIISVVLLHTNFQFPSSHYMPLSSLLGWMWHVAVFFLIGGFFIKGKLGSLYKLLLYFYIPVVLLHNFFIRIGWYDSLTDYGGKYMGFWDLKKNDIYVVTNFLFCGT